MTYNPAALNASMALRSAEFWRTMACETMSANPLAASECLQRAEEAQARAVEYEKKAEKCLSL